MSKNNTDLQGRKNVYICPAKHKTVTIDRDKGVTPMFLQCKHEGCTLDARSCFYPVGLEHMEPTYEWWKPTLEELHAEVRDFCRENKLNYRNTLPTFWEHWSQGGLSLRKIVQPLNTAAGCSNDPAPVVGMDCGGRNAGKAAMLGERYGRAGRNDGCPCGSGKKYKHCCLKLQK